MPEPILSVRNLNVKFSLRGQTLHAIRDVSLDVMRGESLAIVGESGSGKSVFVKSFMGLNDKNGWIDSGEILYEGKNLAALKSEKEWGTIRGGEIAMVMQDPMTSLNPLMTIGAQILEAIELHQRLHGAEAKKAMLDILRDVGITDPEKRARQYPHEFSGGMRQRVVIAVAVACKPKILICDEPTTALDVTIQAQILELLQQLSQDMGMSILLITHNFGVVAETCQRTSVMYAGKVVETGETRELLRSARHPYSRALIRSIPGGGARGSRLETIPGSPPALFEPPASCMFAPRCPYADETCRTGYPAMADCGDGHLAACFKPLTEEVSAHV